MLTGVYTAATPPIQSPGLPKETLLALRFRLIPRNEDFYVQFSALAEQLRVGAELLERMLAQEPVVWDKVDEIKEVEHKCDHLTHQIIQRLNSTFVTPIDREDIHALAKSLDDVMDAIDASARFVRLYKIKTLRFGARELARIISLGVDQVRLAIEALEKRAGVAERAVKINRLENEADRVHEGALRRLFDEESDPVLIIKWKEILDVLEDATDRCEDVANLLEGVVVKNA
ncbi:MAG: DUF47 domain-containing protein [Acidobacteria bacterium]|nr:MAG: DUF47 domain-containing protein [Acidobacteriota bacterium]